MKFYAKEITDVGRQVYAVHDGVHAGTVRIMAVGRPGREIVLDAVAAIRLRDALSDFLVDPDTYRPQETEQRKARESDPPTMIITFSGDVPAEFADCVIVALRKHKLR